MGAPLSSQLPSVCELFADLIDRVERMPVLAEQAPERAILVFRLRTLESMARRVFGAPSVVPVWSAR